MAKAPLRLSRITSSRCSGVFWLKMPSQVSSRPSK